MNKYIIIVVKLHSFMQCKFIFAVPHGVGGGSVEEWSDIGGLFGDA